METLPEFIRGFDQNSSEDSTRIFLKIEPESLWAVDQNLSVVSTRISLGTLLWIWPEYLWVFQQNRSRHSASISLRIPPEFLSWFDLSPTGNWTRIPPEMRPKSFWEFEQNSSGDSTNIHGGPYKSTSNPNILSHSNEQAKLTSLSWKV